MSKRWASFHVATLIGISILLFYPILKHPHWGTFDDANIILQLGRRIHDIPETYSYILLGGVKRVGYFKLLMLLWNIAPENSTFFYLFNCGVFALTSALIYLNALLLSRRPWLSFAVTCLLFSVPGLFEVIYTLDKQEIYLPLLFSLSILINILNARFKSGWYQITGFGLLLFALSSTAFSFKETSGLLVLFSGLLCLSTWLTKGIDPQQRLKQTVLLGCVLLPCAFNLFAQSVEPSRQYVVLTFDATKILTKIIGYAQLIPVYFSACFFNIAVILRSMMQKPKLQTADHKLVGVALALSTCCLAAPVAFASFDTFDTLLLYIWLPTYVFLLPALTFVVGTVIAGQKTFDKIVISSLLLLAICLFPIEWIRGQFQFNMDALTHEVALFGASACKKEQSQVIGALPIFTPTALEVPENIEFFIRDQITPGYYDVANEKFSDNKFAMLNFLTTQIDKSELSDLGKVVIVQTKCDFRCPPEFAGWRGCQLVAGGTPYKSWVSRPLSKGSLLFVPYGNVQLSVAYRGWGLFGNDIQNNLYSFPQLKLVEERKFEKQIKNLYGAHYKMGWKIFRVTDAEPISMPDSTSDSWLSNNAKLYYNSPKNILEFDTTQPISNNWSVTDDGGETQKLSPLLIDGRSQMIIKLTGKNSGRHWLQFSSTNSSDKFHCDAIRLTEKPSQIPVQTVAH